MYLENWSLFLNSLKEVIEEELIKEDITETISNESNIVEPFDEIQKKEETKSIENMWSDVAELMRNDPSISKIYGKRMRKTLTKFE